jgi:hypothetical protein
VFAAGAPERRLRVELFYARERSDGAKEARELEDTMVHHRPFSKVMVTMGEAPGVMRGDLDMADAISSLGAPLAACFHTLPAPRVDSMTVTLDVDDAGVPTGVSSSDDGWLDAATRSCIDRTLRSTGVECPVSDGERHLVFDVGVGR